HLDGAYPESPPLPHSLRPRRPSAAPASIPASPVRVTAARTDRSAQRGALRESPQSQSAVSQHPADAPPDPGSTIVSGVSDSEPATGGSKPECTFPMKDALHAPRSFGIAVAYEYHPAFVTKSTSAPRASHVRTPVPRQSRTDPHPLGGQEETKQ